MRVFAVAALLINFAVPATSTTLADDVPRPNIVVILCDDLGYSDVGFNGSEDIKTPHLDALAHAGTIFTSAYVPHPFCGPSRMGLMTGRYPHTMGAPFNLPAGHHGLEEYNKLGVDLNEPLISTVLQDAGYFTGAIGKWHMGMTTPYHPNTRGFDEYYGFLGGGHNYFPSQYRPAYEQQRRAGKKLIYDYLLPLERNGEDVEETEYITDALSREAVSFVKQGTAKEEPFFLYLAYNAPHVPLEAREDDLALYQHIADKKRRTYAAMVHAVDRGVGRVVDALRQADELSETLIVFFSDNGGKLSEGATNRPLREGKGSTYEGGYRVPMLWHWPDKVPAGERFAHSISALDFYPTFARLAGASIPAGKTLDGVDLWDDFRAGRSPRPGQVVFAMRHRKDHSDVGARRDGWKASRVGRGSWKLFDLTNDWGESHDLSAEHPDILAALVSEAEQWSKTHKPPLWFHDAGARDQWSRSSMPRFRETFECGTGSFAKGD